MHDASDMTACHRLRPDMILAGIVCGSLSSLNTYRVRNKGCIADRHTGTGETFGHAKDFALQVEAPVVVLENTVLLDSGSGGVNPFGEIVAEMSAAGYSCLKFDMSAQL